MGVAKINIFKVLLWEGVTKMSTLCMLLVGIPFDNVDNYGRPRHPGPKTSMATNIKICEIKVAHVMSHCSEASSSGLSRKDNQQSNRLVSMPEMSQHRPWSCQCCVDFDKVWAEMITKKKAALHHRIGSAVYAWIRMLQLAGYPWRGK